MAFVALIKRSVWEVCFLLRMFLQSGTTTWNMKIDINTTKAVGKMSLNHPTIDIFDVCFIFGHFVP